MPTGISTLPKELEIITESAAALSNATARYTAAVDALVERRYGARSMTAEKMSQITIALSRLGDAINSFFSKFSESGESDMSASEVIDTLVRFSSTDAGPVLVTQAEKELIDIITPLQVAVQSLLDPPPKIKIDIPTGSIPIIPRPRPDIPVLIPGGGIPRPIGGPGPDPAPPFDVGGTLKSHRSTSTPVIPSIPTIPGTIPIGPRNPSTISTPVEPAIPTLPGPIRRGPLDPSTISTPVDPGIPTIPGPIRTGPLDPSTISTPVDPGIPSVPRPITGPLDPSTISTPVRDPVPNIDPPPPTDPSTISTPFPNPPNIDPPPPIDPSTIATPVTNPPNIDPPPPMDPSTISTPITNPPNIYPRFSNAHDAADVGSFMTPDGGLGDMRFEDPEMESIVQTLSPEARAIAEGFNEMLGGTLRVGDSRLSHCKPPAFPK